MRVPIIVYELRSGLAEGETPMTHATFKRAAPAQHVLDAAGLALQADELISPKGGIVVVPVRTTIELESTRVALSQGYEIDYEAFDAVIAPPAEAPPAEAEPAPIAPPFTPMPSQDETPIESEPVT